MPECCNFECYNHTWGKKLRCSQCRHYQKMTCSSCGTEMRVKRAIRCKTCSNANRDEIVKKSQSRPEYREKIKTWQTANYYKKKQLNNSIPVI